MSEKKSGSKKLPIKKLIFIVVIFLIAGIVVKTIFFPTKKPIMVSLGEVTKEDITKSLELKGLSESKDSAEITSAYNFKVTQILVQEGEKVKKDQVLATLDTQQLRDEIAILSKQIGVDQMRLNEADAERDKIYTSTDSLEIAVNEAQKAVDEAIRQETIKKQLFDSGALAAEEYKQSQLAVSTAQSQLQTAKETLEKAKHDTKAAIDSATPKASAREAINVQRLQLSQKRKDLENLQIKSPIDGIVTRVYAKMGRQARDTEQNRPMFVVEDVSEKFIKVNVSEYSISEISLGQEVIISSEVLGDDTLKGKVTNISPTGEQDTSGNTRVIPVEIQVIEGIDRLPSGVSCQVKIILDSAQNVMQVPFESLSTDDQGTYMFVYEDGIVRKIYVETGLESNFTTEVRSKDLKEGMKVVSSPDPELKDGYKVIDMDSLNPDAKADESKENKNTQGGK